jgi:hypothetical protein
MVIEKITIKHTLQEEFKNRTAVNKNPKEYSILLLVIIIILTMAVNSLYSFSLKE